MLTRLTRSVVECAFGIMVSKFRCLNAAPLSMEPANVEKIVLACCPATQHHYRNSRKPKGDKIFPFSDNKDLINCESGMKREHNYDITSSEKKTYQKKQIGQK
ncbi:hypothetical protein DERF_000586 [Dermatophagoides farinae]|uniref:DDE Tnp4 domain-containing protein n=1 Tax=Dermatophagoides farinae TaxID=6954 RepID=A0A922I7N4_DERFA|nr:hypothetical protein DERF_000586 [Dermatophagoides farinae]